MKTSKILKKQIIVEVLALLLLCGSLIYATFAIHSSDNNKIDNYDDIVTVLEDSKFKKLKISSDGVGLNTDGIIYTITNNRNKKVSYKLVIVPNVHNEKILKQIRVSLDDITVVDLISLERAGGGYVLGEMELDSGYTRIHSIKLWYKLESDSEIESTDIEFDYKIID